MTKLNKRDQFNLTIPEPVGFSELLKSLLPEVEGRLLPRPIFKTDSSTPPLFLFVESRGEDNWLSSFTYYGGNGQSAQIGIGAREVLSLMGSSYIKEAERGKILSNFCRIDFCIDVFICIHEGIFENRIQWIDLKKEFEEDGRYATTGKKIKVLREHRLIRDHTRAQLSKAMHIRNVLAHQYMPEAGLGLTKTDRERYPTIITAIELIFGAAWIELLKDYSPHQLVVARWLQP